MTTPLPGEHDRSSLEGGVVRGVAAAALVWGAAYLAWRAVDTWRNAQPVLFAVLYVAEVAGWFALASFAFLAWRVPSRPRPQSQRRYRVDVFVCTADEGLDLVASTLLGCERITTPHTTYLLDDGRRPDVRRLADRFGARYVTRSTDQHARAGSINRALKVSRGELILVLDADHVPQPDILDATLGYFDDEMVAVVQTPHDFANHDSSYDFETGRHDESLFFEVLMPGKDRHDATFWCGSAAVLRRHAIEEIGGVAGDTTAEDLHTSLRLHEQGWRIRYHDEILVSGLAPHDRSSYLLEHDRRAHGDLAVLRTKESPLRAGGLDLRQRASYLSSLLGHLVPVQRIVLVGVLVAMLVSGRIPLHASAPQLAVFWLPWMVLALAASTLLGRGRASLWDRAYSRILTTGADARAVLSLAWPSGRWFGVAPKEGLDRGGWASVRQLRLVLLLATAVVVAVGLRLLAIAGAVPLRPLPGFALGIGLFFAGWELVPVSAALARVGHRQQVRRHIRLPVELAGVVDGSVVRVVDLTPGGAGLIGPRPVDVGREIGLELDLATDQGDLHPVQVHFAVCSCRPDGDTAWRLGGTLTPFTADDGAVLIEHCHLVAERARPAGEVRSGPARAAAASVENRAAHG